MTKFLLLSIIGAAVLAACLIAQTKANIVMASIQ